MQYAQTPLGFNSLTRAVASLKLEPTKTSLELPFVRLYWIYFTEGLPGFCTLGENHPYVAYRSRPSVRQSVTLLREAEPN